MAYVDIATLQTIAAGEPLSAATVSQIRDNGEWFADPPQCSVFNSAAQSVADSSTVSLTANSENYDNNSMHSTAGSTSRITFQTAGRYEVFANVNYAADSDGYRRVSFLVNGTTTIGGQTMPAAPTVATRLSASRSVTVSAGDYIEVQVAHTAGAALDVTLDEFRAKWESR